MADVRLATLALVAAATSWLACASANSPTSNGRPCVEDYDCLAGEICAKGTCTAVGIPDASEAPSKASLTWCALSLGGEAPSECPAAGSAPCSGKTSIDFGQVAFGASAAREVALWNSGPGNGSVEVTSATISDDEGLGDLFSVQVFEIAEEEQSVSLPTSFGPCMEGREILFVRASFAAKIDGLLPAEMLVIEWRDPADAPHSVAIPLTGSILGCRPGFVDLDEEPGCETECVPTGTELCDALDNDCDGLTDEDFALGGACDGEDSDDCDEGVWVCNLDQMGVACDDDDEENDSESCDDVDNDCNGSIDEGCDDDEDGFCDTSLSLVGTPSICSSGGGDCDDSTAAINPETAEVCDDVDNNCEGSPPIDEGCDDDNDDFCEIGATLVGLPATCLGGTGDCDDDDASVLPGAEEICDDVDNNCAGSPTIDEGCDDDGDGYCDEELITVGTPAICEFGIDDCNDADETVNPGASESCSTGADDNCNGTINEGCQLTLEIFPASPGGLTNCQMGTGDISTYGPYLGYVYKNIPAFTVRPGDTISFDFMAENDADVVDSFWMGHTNTNGGGRSDLDSNGFTQIVSAGTASPPRGNTTTGDYELTFTITGTYSFPGGGLILRFQPQPPMTSDSTCTTTVGGAFPWDSSGHFVERFLRDGAAMSTYPNDIVGFRLVYTP